MADLRPSARDRFDVKVEGVDQLVLKLKGLSNDLQYKGGRAALRRAANVIRDAAINNAWNLDDTATAEAIAKNIVVRWSSKAFRANGDLNFRIGVLGGAKQSSEAYKKLGIYKGKGKDNPGGDTFYWRFLEFGKEETPARPFMRPALEASSQKATDTFIREYEKYVDRVLARAIKKASRAD